MSDVSKVIINCLKMTMLFLVSSVAFANNQLLFTIQGIDGASLKNVTARLQATRDAYPDLTQANIKEIYSHAPGEIKKALQPFGYFHSSVEPSLQQTDKAWIATFKINPGVALKIKNIHVTVIGPGKDNQEIIKTVRHLPIKVGATFQVDDYSQTKATLIQTLNEQGYIKANITTKKILIDVKQNTAVIILQIDTGERYYFGKVRFNATGYSDHFMQRFVALKSNDAFSSEKLLALQQDMGSSYYFRQVSITPDFDNISDHQVPIVVDTILPKSQAYNFGLGYGTFTGPRLTAGVNFRRITDTGQHFDAQLKLSSVLSALAAKYYIPGKNPLTDFWTAGLNIQKFNPKNGASNSKSVTVGYLTKFKEVQASLNLNYLVERYSVIDTPTQNSRLLYPALNLSYSKADDVLNPKFGKALSFNLQGATETLFSATSFLQGDLKAKYLFSPTQYNSVLLRGELGYTVVHDLQQLPLSMRFFAGGQNSIRGFPDSSIGPGRYLQTASIEYRNKIVGNWNAALFYDVGNASDHFGTDWNRGVGVGVIYNSVLGPVKLYVARAESKPSKPKSIEFSIGPEF